MNMQDAISRAAELAYEQDADKYAVMTSANYWLVLHHEDPQAFAPDVVKRVLVHSDGVDKRHLDDD